MQEKVMANAVTLSVSISALGWAMLITAGVLISIRR
jgi:hypothetical protein